MKLRMSKLFYKYLLSNIVLFLIPISILGALLYNSMKTQFISTVRDTGERNYINVPKCDVDVEAWIGKKVKVTIEELL